MRKGGAFADPPRGQIREQSTLDPVKLGHSATSVRFGIPPLSQTMQDNNPYSPPSADAGSSFHPKHGWSVACRRTRGDNRPAKRDPRTGEILLGDRGIVWAVGCISFTVMPVIFLLALCKPPEPNERFIPWLFGGGLGVASVYLLVSAFTRIRVSDDSITVETLLRPRRRIRWSDIDRFSISHYGTLRLRSKNGSRLSISSELHGLIDFVDLLERHLPEKVRANQRADVEAYCRFVRCE